MSALTGKELATLDYIAIGLTDREIAAVYDYTEAGIKSRVSSILCKLNARNRPEAVHNAWKRNILHHKHVIERPLLVVCETRPRKHWRGESPW